MYNTIIIGAGSIGALKKDKYDSLETKNILTHAHAVTKHKKTKLIGIVDIDPEKRKKAKAKWNIPTFQDINQIKKEIDIIIISVPTEFHLNIIEQAVQKNPKLIIVEKPFTKNHEEAIKAKNLLKNIPVIVNYTRRFDKKTNTIIKKMLSEIYHCKITYRRGLVRDGSHAIDLMRYYFGEFKEGFIFDKNNITDLSENDPTYTAYLSFEKCPHVFMGGVDSRKYSAYEIDIFTDQGRIVLCDHHENLIIYFPIKEKVWGGHITLLSNNKIKMKTNIKKILLPLLDNAIDVIENKTAPICSIEDAIEVHRILDRLIQKRKGEKLCWQ